jgi:hypothetical protein
MKPMATVFALALAFSVVAFARGNETHVMGTVTSIFRQLHYRGNYIEQDGYGDFKHRH